MEIDYDYEKKREEEINRVLLEYIKGTKGGQRLALEAHRKGLVRALTK